MFFRKYWIPLLVFIVAIVGVSLYYLQTRPPKEPILIVKPVEFEKPPAKAPVVEQREQVGHFHSDGTFHAEVEQPAKEPYEPTVEINHEWASLTDEERLQREKEWNQQVIAEYANDPRYAEIHKLMSENEYPYAPQVQAEIREAYNRFYLKRSAHYKAVAAIDAKMDNPNISARELGRLDRERHELRERYKGGQ